MGKRILITGSSGFVGFNLSSQLLRQGYEIVGIDNIHDDGDLIIKKKRVEYLNKTANYKVYTGSITDAKFLEELFAKEKFDAVIHLAALAGVRVSTDFPRLFMETNVMATLNLLECCQKHAVKRFLCASSSSVYGGTNERVAETANINRPLSIYAASKSALEQICYTYHHLYNINMGIMRFFTVYGPWGRPNMLILSLLKRVDTGEEVHIFGKGDSIRTYIYIEDIVNAIQSLLEKNTGYQTFNFAGTERTSVNEAVKVVEEYFNKTAKVVNLPADPSDAQESSGDITHANQILGWKPQHTFKQGVEKTAQWYVTHKDWLVDGIPSPPKH